MKTIVRLRPAPGVSLDSIRRQLVAEEQAVWSAYVSGALRGICYDLSVPGGVLLALETQDIESARTLTFGLPLVRRGMLQAELIPTRPYDGLAKLFAGEHGFAQSTPESWAEQPP